MVVVYSGYFGINKNKEKDFYVVQKFYKKS